MKVWQVFAGLAIGFVISFFVPDWVSFAFVFGFLLLAYFLAERNERRRHRLSRPLVLCIDNSGSMHGTPSKWALSLAQILKERCLNADRTLHVLHYAHDEPIVKTYPGGAGDLWWPARQDGGTRYDLVLNEAMRLAIPGGHIMFVTDGMAPIVDGWVTPFNEDRTKWDVAVDSWVLSASLTSAQSLALAPTLLAFSRNSFTVTPDTDPHAIANKAQEA